MKFANLSSSNRGVPVSHRKSPPHLGGLAAFAWLVVSLVGLPSRGDDRPAPPREASTPIRDQLPGLHLLHGPWAGSTVHRESVLFVRGDDGKPTAKLLFDAERVLTVRRADGELEFEAGRDYRLGPDGSTLELPPGSRVPFRAEADFFPPKGAAQSIPHRTGHPETSLLFGEGHFFHDLQAEVTYVPRRVEWKGDLPAFAGDRLPRTLARLNTKKPLTLAISGDSISQGYNASGFTKAPPFMPPYPNLVAAELERTYGSAVTLRNHAIAGWSAGQGVKDLDNLLQDKPDLVIIAYGMNDVGRRNPEGFKAAIATMLRRIKEANPEAEVVLVASMIGNPDWAATPLEMFPKYRDALASLQGPGVVLADLTSIWRELLGRKRFGDVTGNGVNHPNDYGHRLYAQVILALLVDPERAGRYDSRDR
jgi:acyl-CoA thioesterase-1